ncbi:hypothetical protein CAEBREN_06615 [Caenorhabditis brenneri]|uniref:Uncharacterized protein n=1 Tax=Caenorhabditis brenneri TaxID=135651 RepID=G0MBA3_CAEBE|nr:hypothetical protein CAEBREN_06615 [Caenorhabditis brenneri]
MDIPTLHSLCIQSIATHIENGLKFNEVLKDDEKDELLQCFQSKNGPHTQRAVLELLTSWKFKQLYIGSTFLPALVNKIEMDSVERLGIFSVKQETLQRIKNQLVEKYGTQNLNVDILKLIEMFIKPENRGKLRHLDLTACDIQSRRNMFEEMAQLFPNITALVLNSTNLTNQNLNDVCRSYPNLTQLRVVYNAFNDLTGISVLRNLVYLNMAGCHIQNGYKMRGIFTLNSLRVLNISSARVQPLSRNLTNYLSCGQALPLLEFIDVSCNAITRGQLKKLVQTHPTLSTVVLIGTPLQARAQFEDHDVELITVQNLEFCIKAMRCYPKAMTANKTRVMNEMMNFLVQSYKRQKKSVLKKCLQELLNIERHDYSNAQRQPIRCLLQLCRKGRIDKFSFADVQKILYLFLNVCPSTGRVKYYSNDVCRLQFSIWKCISSSETILKHSGNAGPLCRKAVEIMKEYPHSVSIRTRGMWHTCFQVMQTVFNQNSEAIQSICADSVFIKKFLMRTMTLIHKKHVVSVEACKFANILILNSANNIDQGLLTVYLCHLLKSSIQVQENELHQTDILNYMQNLINSNRLIHWVYYRDSSLFSLLTNLVKRRGFRAQKLAIMFFCWLKHYYECSAQNGVLESLSQMEAKATPIVNTIYWYQQTGDDKLDIYNYLVCHGRGEVREWAKWILNRVPRDVPAVEVQPTWEYSQWEETKNWFAI